MAPVAARAAYRCRDLQIYGERDSGLPFRAARIPCWRNIHGPARPPSGPHPVHSHRLHEHERAHAAGSTNGGGRRCTHRRAVSRRAGNPARSGPRAAHVLAPPRARHDPQRWWRCGADRAPRLPHRSSGRPATVRRRVEGSGRGTGRRRSRPGDQLRQARRPHGSARPRLKRRREPSLRHHHPCATRRPRGSRADTRRRAAHGRRVAPGAGGGARALRRLLSRERRGVLTTPACRADGDAPRQCWPAHAQVRDGPLPASRQGPPRDRGVPPVYECRIRTRGRLRLREDERDVRDRRGARRDARDTLLQRIRSRRVPRAGASG